MKKPLRLKRHKKQKRVQRVVRAKSKPMTDAELIEIVRNQSLYHFGVALFNLVATHWPDLLNPKPKNEEPETIQ